MFGLGFFTNSLGMGFALAMDAFSVSLANGLNEPKMRTRKMCGVAGVFALFQFAMPMIGWTCVHTIVEVFKDFEKWIPWIALAILGFIGGKMLYESIKNRNCEECEKPAVGIVALIVQGIGTSIDALSEGFTIAPYTWFEALVACLLIGLLTFIICFAGIEIGKRSGTKLSGAAGILGGAILIGFGIYIFVKGVFFS